MTSFSRRGWALFLATLVVAAAQSCAQGTDPPASSSEGGGGADDPTGASSSSSSSSSGAGGAGGAGGQGGAGGAGGAGGEGGSGVPSSVVASLQTSSLYVNCAPGATPAVAGDFTVTYDNSKGMSPALPAVTEAKLMMTHLGNAYDWTFSVTPNSSFVPPGAAPTVTHKAAAGSGSGMGGLCDYCSGVWTLVVTWNLGGKTASDSLMSLPIMCAF